MKAQEFKSVKKQVIRYIREGRPLAAASIHSQYDREFTLKQYYDLLDIIHKALIESEK